MRIVEIEVEQLFGTFDHRVPLNTGDRITLIHGPNGFGKTILLEMLHDLFNSRYGTLRRIPFRQLVIRFADGSRITVSESYRPEPPTAAAIIQTAGKAAPRRGNDRDGKRLWSSRRLNIACHRDDADPGVSFNLPESPSTELLNRISSEVPHLFRSRKTSSWFDQTTGEILNADDVLDRYGDRLSRSQQEPEWWQRVKSSVRVEMIRVQRLAQPRSVVTQQYGPLDPWPQPSPPESRVAINEYANELIRILREKLAESAALSQSLDRTFPNRLLKRIQIKGPSENELAAKLGELERKREQLRDTGLLDEQEEMPLLPTDKLGAETRDVLAVYVEDAEKKLGIFEDLVRKIELFQDIINSCFLYKRLSISRQDGFVFTTCNGGRLPLSALSSGEQHEVVLLYELLFRIEPDSLVLIDEPEISLHVAWQKKFLEDLAKITELASFDVLIATHSPQIIHKRWDLTVELASPMVEAEVAAIP